MALWLKENALDSDVVISTRVRLARNLAGIPFPHRIAGTQRAEQVKETAKRAFLRDGMDFSYQEIRELSPINKTRLVEQHIISRELASGNEGAMILSPDESICVMIGEEDHYRLQCLRSGYDVDTAMKMAFELDKMLNKEAEYAFDPELGYLTSCPTNVGTGMRVSVMLHLPGLTLSGGIRGILSALGNFGVTARGCYGEGSEAAGDIYQISNQVTLGVSEKDIAKNLKTVVSQIIKKEREARNALLHNQGAEVKDRIWRSYGLLKYAWKMDTSEALSCISLVNMGVGLGIIEANTSDELYGLMMDIMPGMLSGEGRTAQDRDVVRARMIRNTIH